MTKGGIRMLGREAAIELAKYGITVNTIEPGQINVGVQSARESRPIDLLPQTRTEQSPYAQSGISAKSFRSDASASRLMSLGSSALSHLMKASL